MLKGGGKTIVRIRLGLLLGIAAILAAGPMPAKAAQV